MRRPPPPPPYTTTEPRKSNERHALTDADVDGFFAAASVAGRAGTLNGYEPLGWAYDEALWRKVLGFLAYLRDDPTVPRRVRKRSKRLYVDLKWMVAQAHRIDTMEDKKRRRALGKVVRRHG